MGLYLSGLNKERKIAADEGRGNTAAKEKMGKRDEIPGAS